MKTIFLVISLAELIFFGIFFSLVPLEVFAGVNETNVTVTTLLDVGNVYPEVLNVSVNDGNDISLTPNSTKLVSCVALIRDWNGDGDIKNVSARFFDNSASSYSDSDDNNSHYTNTSCFINTSFGSWNGVSDDAYLALANCTIGVWYYANPGTWNCSIMVNDTYDWTGFGSNTTQIQQLLALGLPDTINYGTVNATYVSNENITNVTNYGNVIINLSLSGYAISPGDGLAMNCTVGSIKNISIEHEKYNLTASNPGPLTLAQTSPLYINLTSNVVVKEFNLNYRHNDTYNEAINATYWRIYVPVGVAGTCKGNIVFGATQAPES